MSTYRSVVTSCWISAIGNSGARSSGPTGCRVPGCSTGGGGAGRSGMRLYQRRGISDSESRDLVVVGSTVMSLIIPPRAPAHYRDLGVVVGLARIIAGFVPTTTPRSRRGPRELGA